ncbi:MAG TPA: type II secretion system protein GspL [Gammaproteobacteria bacterium]
MAEHFFVRLQDSSDEVATLVLNSEGHVVEPVRRERLVDVAARAQGRRVIVLVPSTEVLAARADLPKASQARLRQLLPYSLEESLATDIEALHFAAGSRTDSGALLVSVVAHSRVEAWLRTLDSVGLRPTAVYSEADGLPDTPATLNLLVEGQRVYGRLPGAAPFVLDGMSVAEALDVLQSQAAGGAPAFEHVLVWLEGGSERLAELAEIHSRVASLDVKALEGGALPRLAATLVFRPGANLLQGKYAPKSDYTGMLRPWRFAAALFLVWVGVALSVQVAEYFSLRSSDAALTAEMMTICTQALNSPVLAQCTTELRGRLAALGEQPAASAGFLSTLAALAGSQVDGGSIEALSYRNRVMDLQLTVPSVMQLDTFAQRIGDDGRFVARIQSTNPSDAGVQGRVQIAEAAP